MSEKSRARAAQRLTGHAYQRCLKWMRDNHERVSARQRAMRGSDRTATEEAALYYQEQQERMTTE